MNENAPGTQVADPFRAVLKPHRSLGSAGFLALMGLFGAISFVAGMVFLMLGAWPVLGFFGLDLIVLYVAFQLNYRSGRLAETVELGAEVLELTRIHPSGRREAFTFNPYWVRVVLVEGRNGQTDLRLRSHSREVPFGRFLTDDERHEFATALSGALFRARGVRI